MATHSWANLHKILILFGVVFAVGIIVPLVIAVQFGRVTPYAPYISDCGGNFPEAGIFSSCLVISALLSQCIVMFRWLVLNDINSKDSYMFLNSTAVMLGSLTTLAFIVVASFPSTSLSTIHNAAAGTACMCILLYMFCQTWLSFRIAREQTVSKIRLLILILSFISLSLTAIFGVMGSAHWKKDIWVGVKTPQDEGFLYYVLSASAEWALAILFFSFYATFIPEFKECIFQFRVVSSKL